MSDLRQLSTLLKVFDVILLALVEEVGEEPKVIALYSLNPSHFLVEDQHLQFVIYP